jgi:hypothetical protein
MGVEEPGINEGENVSFSSDVKIQDDLQDEIAERETGEESTQENEGEESVVEYGQKFIDDIKGSALDTLKPFIYSLPEGHKEKIINLCFKFLSASSAYAFIRISMDASGYSNLPQRVLLAAMAVGLLLTSRIQYGLEERKQKRLKDIIGVDSGEDKKSDE